MEVDSLGSRRIDSDTIRAYIQEYIRRAPSGVTAEEIKSVLSERYGLEGTAWKRLVYNDVSIVRVGARRFVHADRLSLRPDPDGFRPVIDYINSWLDAEGLVNARMVFRDQAKICASLGIISPDHLYTILETSYSFDYDLPWFPQIIKWGVRRPGIRTCGVTSEVEDYLERRSCECTYSELLTYFVEERCYLKSAVTRIAKSPKVARYTPHSVIHLKALGWTDRLQEALEDCALSHLRSHQPAGAQHARLSALMEDPALPSLPAQHSWTATLLGDLLCRRDNFALSTTAGERCFAASRYDMPEDTSPHEPAPSAGNPVSSVPEPPGTPSTEDPFGEAVARMSEQAAMVLKAHGVGDLQGLLSIRESRLRITLGATEETVEELLRVRDDLILGSHAASRRDETSGTPLSDSHPPEESLEEHPDDSSVVSLAIGLRPEQAIAGCVADLGLPEGDLVSLRGIAVYPEDSLDSLSRLAPGVLASCGISETGFQAILGKCTSLANLQLRDTPIVQEADAIGMEGWSVRTMGVPWRDAETLRAAGIRVLGDALGRSEKSIVDLLGLGTRSLTCIRLLWQLKTYAKRAKLTMSPSAYVSFDSVVRYLTEPPGSKPKDVRAYTARTGLRDGTAHTLREVGREMRISASRVAQLQKRQERRLNKPSIKERWDSVFRAIHGILEDRGGACTDVELAMHLTERFTWPSYPDARRVAALASLDPSLCISGDRRYVSFASSYPCLECGTPLKAIADVTGDAGGAIEAGECVSKIQPSISQSCRQCEYHRPLFSRGYVLLRAAAHPELRVEGDRIICGSTESPSRDAIGAEHGNAPADPQSVSEAAPEPPPPPKPKRKPLRSRRARVQTRLDLAARQLVVRIGEHELEGDFSEQVHVCAVLRDGDGVELESRILDASRAPKGAFVRSVDIGLPVVEGDLTVDIEYAGDVLQSYPVETLLADEPCMLFSSSGGLVRGAVRDSGGPCMLLREGAQVLPEDAVRSREPLRHGEPYDLAWLDMRACVDEGLVVQWNGTERAFQVTTGRGGKGVVLDGGDRVSRVSVDAQHPVYGGNMPDAVIEPKLSRLRLAVRVFDTGRLPECTIDSDGRVSLGQALERLGVPEQSAAMIDLAWTDSAGKSGKLSVARIPDLLVSFDKRVYIAERDKVARARLSLPSGWELVPSLGIVRIDSGRDDAEIDVEIDLERLPGNARLRLGDAEVPIAIQPPTVQWRVESGQKGGEGPWRSAPAEIWAEDVDTRRFGTLAVMVDADCPVKVALGPSRPQWCTQENREARFSLAEQVQAIRGRGPAGTLRLALVDSGRRQMPPIDVATVLDKWVPVDPAAIVEPIDSPAPPGRQIGLSWGGPAPRGPVGMALRPAWTDSMAFRSSVGAGAHSCTFRADRAVCGPYILTMEDAAADDWGESADPYGETLVWVGGSEPQIREFELVRRGDSWVCSGVVYPGTECSDLIGVVVRSRAGGRVDTVGISHLGDGRFRFAVDDPREDAGIVGVLSATRRGYDGLYRFKAVEHGPGCSAMLRRSSVNQWLSLSQRFPDAVKMWIGGCDVKPIPVPREAGRRILRDLAAGCTAVRFSPDDPGYRGAVELVIPDDERDDPCAGFQLSFASMIVKCIDDGCARKGEVLSQAKWNAEHGPRCKRCHQLGREIRAGFAMQIDTSSTGGRNALDSTVADSCFRVLPDNPAAMLDEARLGQALMDALWGMWRTIGAAPTDGEEIES